LRPGGVDARQRLTVNQRQRPFGQLALLGGARRVTGLGEQVFELVEVDRNVFAVE
jgi:hypothetical protein